MSPEQAKGRPVDKRTDVWAFGVVLFEMLTGKRVFEGDVSETLARVIERDPDFALLPATIPASITRLIRRCVEKDRKRRLRDIADALADLDDALTTPDAEHVPLTGTDSGSPQRLSVASIAIVATTAALGAGLTVWGLMRPEAPRPARFPLGTEPPLSLAGGAPSPVAISPD